MTTSLSKYQLNLVWMYPDLMSTYGDRGNCLALSYRLERRGIKLNIVRHTGQSESAELLKADILFMGGAQDRQQKTVSEDLLKKSKTLSKLIEKSIPGLFICGAYQFLGKYYKTADGTKIPGIGIFDMYTEHPGDQQKRLIGNIVTRWHSNQLVGFENHGGRTYLGKRTNPFAAVIKGFGNNGVDETEGILYKNSIGTYLHGPILPKNPELTDWILETALRIKYQKEILLEKLDDSMEEKARNIILSRLNIKQE